MMAFATDPTVIDIGSEMLLFQAGTFAAWAFFFVFLRTLQGAATWRCRCSSPWATGS